MVQFVSPWILLFAPVGIWLVFYGRRVSYVNLSVRRRRLSLSLRIALVIVLILALAAPVVKIRSSSAPLVLLVDVSSSITDRMLQAERQLVDQTWQGRGATP